MVSQSTQFLVLTSICVIALVLGIWHVCSRPERFTPEQIDQLAERVMRIKNSGINGSDGDGEKEGKSDDAAEDEDSVEVSAEFGPIAVSLYKSNKGIYDKILKHAKSNCAFDMKELGKLLDIPCIASAQ